MYASISSPPCSAAAATANRTSGVPRPWWRWPASTASRDAVGKAYDVDGRRLVIVGVPVPAAASEQALLDDEDLVTDPEVGSSLVRRGHGPAGQPEMIRRVCYRASGC